MLLGNAAELANIINNVRGRTLNFRGLCMLQASPHPPHAPMQAQTSMFRQLMSPPCGSNKLVAAFCSVAFLTRLRLAFANLLHGVLDVESQHVHLSLPSPTPVGRIRTDDVAKSAPNIFLRDAAEAAMK